WARCRTEEAVEDARSTPGAPADSFRGPVDRSWTRGMIWPPSVVSSWQREISGACTPRRTCPVQVEHGKEKPRLHADSSSTEAYAGDFVLRLSRAEETVQWTSQPATQPRWIARARPAEDLVGA